MGLADVTPIYRENVPDILEVSRRTQLHDDRLVTIIDRVRAADEHTVTSRASCSGPRSPQSRVGAPVRTPEGVTLHLVEALGSSGVSVEVVADHPAKPDGIGARRFHRTGRGRCAGSSWR